MMSAERSFDFIRLLTRIRQENPALWSRILSFACEAKQQDQQEEAPVQVVVPAPANFHVTNG
jgi:hypothetical protein